MPRAQPPPTDEAAWRAQFLAHHKGAQGITLRSLNNDRFARNQPRVSGSTFRFSEFLYLRAFFPHIRPYQGLASALITAGLVDTDCWEHVQHVVFSRTALPSTTQSLEPAKTSTSYPRQELLPHTTPKKPEGRTPTEPPGAPRTRHTSDGTDWYSTELPMGTFFNLQIVMRHVYNHLNTAPCSDYELTHKLEAFRMVLAYISDVFAEPAEVGKEKGAEEEVEEDDDGDDDNEDKDGEYEEDEEDEEDEGDEEGEESEEGYLEDDGDQEHDADDEDDVEAGVFPPGPLDNYSPSGLDRFDLGDGDFGIADLAAQLHLSSSPTPTTVGGPARPTRTAAPTHKAARLPQQPQPDNLPDKERSADETINSEFFTLLVNTTIVQSQSTALSPSPRPGRVLYSRDSVRLRRTNAPCIPHRYAFGLGQDPVYTARVDGYTRLPVPNAGRTSKVERQARKHGKTNKVGPVGFDPSHMCYIVEIKASRDEPGLHYQIAAELAGFIYARRDEFAARFRQHPRRAQHVLLVSFCGDAITFYLAAFQRAYLAFLISVDAKRPRRIDPGVRGLAGALFEVQAFGPFLPVPAVDELEAFVELIVALDTTGRKRAARSSSDGAAPAGEPR